MCCFKIQNQHFSYAFFVTTRLKFCIKSAFTYVIYGQASQCRGKTVSEVLGIFAFIKFRYFVLEKNLEYSFANICFT